MVRIRAARCLGASEAQIFFKIVLPSSMPYVLTGMRVALGFCFMGIVAAELIGAREGIGFLIMNSLQLLQTNVLFVRSEEHTSELQSLMRISYAVFCLKQKNNTTDS